MKFDQYMSCHKSVVSGQHCTNCSQFCPYFDTFLEGSKPVQQQPLKNYHKFLMITTKYSTSIETSTKEKSTLKY